MASSVIPIIKGPTGLPSLGKFAEQALKKIKKVDPRDRYVLLFPDSEAAYVGMGLNLLNCKPAEEVFEQASEKAQKNLFKLCLDGPRSDLINSVENRQIATFVTTHATLAKLQDEHPFVVERSKNVAGFGIGFMNSLVFSGAMTLEHAFEYIQYQAKAIDKINKLVPYAKVKLRLRPATSKIRVCRAAEEHCIRMRIPEELAKCSVTKQSYAHVLEIGGHEEAIRYLETDGLRLFKFHYISRIDIEKNSHHSHMMEPVRRIMESYLDKKMRDDPNFLSDPQKSSVYSSIAGRRLRVIKYIKRDLLNYPVQPVKTEQLLHCLYDRPHNLPQPNTYVLWNKRLLKDLSMVNTLAWRKAKLYS